MTAFQFVTIKLAVAGNTYLAVLALTNTGWKREVAKGALLIETLVLLGVSLAVPT